jgi:uncharacterized cupin superfamily protein
MIIVLGGRPSLRTLDGIRELGPGEVIACPVGRRGAHQLQNNSDEPVRALATSAGDKILVHTALPGASDRLALAFRRESQVDRLAGELRQPVPPD